MSTPLHHKRSAVPGKIPTTSDLALGELAINTYDGKIYLKRNVGGTESVIDVTATAAGASWGGITGTLADQTDLQTALNAKAPNSHVGAGGVSNHPNATGATSGFMAPADKTKLDGIDSGAQVNSITSVAGKTGAVTLAKADVGLSAVDNTSDANKPVSTAQATALALKANLASPTFTGTVGGITKAMVGLGSVDNTADTAKPVSTAQAAAIALKADTTALAGYVPLSTYGIGGLATSIANMGVTDNSIVTGVYNYDTTLGHVGGPSGVTRGQFLHSRRAGGGGEVQLMVTESPAATIHTRTRTTGAWTAWKEYWSSSNFDPDTKANLSAPSFTNQVNSTGIVRSTGYAGLNTSGVGVELYYHPGTSAGNVLAYDRGAGIYKSMHYDGLAHVIKVSGTTSVEIGTNGPEGYYGMLRVAGGLRLNGPQAQLGLTDRTTNRLFCFYATGDTVRLFNGDSDACWFNASGAFFPGGANGGNIAGNGAGVQINGTSYFSGGSGPQLLWANAGGWVRIPRVFVGGTDPGVAAADGDVWIV